MKDITSTFSISLDKRTNVQIGSFKIYINGILDTAAHVDTGIHKEGSIKDLIETYHDRLNTISKND